MTELFHPTLELSIGVYDRTISASKELAMKGAVRSAETFYHTGEKPFYKQ
jgi:hypothetical protein